MIGFKEGLYLGIVVTLVSVITICAFRPGTNLLAVIHAAGSVAVGASAVIAYHLYRSTVTRSIEERRKDISKGFLDQSIVMLERLHEMFGADQDRVQWLSAARMIVRFGNMKARITEPEHLEILDEHEEFWRLDFYTLLQECKDRFTEEFFLRKEEARRSSPGIDPRSVVVIFDFAKWREGKPDPLDKIEDEELFRKGAVGIDFDGVVNFLGHHYHRKDRPSAD